jgi:hypothetical protein
VLVPNKLSIANLSRNFILSDICFLLWIVRGNNLENIPRKFSDIFLEKLIGIYSSKLLGYSVSLETDSQGN